MNIIKYLILLVLILLFTTGCSNPEGELENMGITFTPEEYFEYGVNKEDLIIIRLFLDAGMDIETKNSNGRTVLNYALRQGNFYIIEVLVKEYDADLTKDNVIDFPVYKYPEDDMKMLEIVPYLFENGGTFTNVGENGGGGAGAEIVAGTIKNRRQIRFDTAMLFAQNGLSEENSTYMLSALYSDFKRHLKYLRLGEPDQLTNEEHVKAETQKAMTLAAQLLKNGADMSKAFKNFSSDEWDRGDWIIDFVQLALDNGVDINSVNRSGITVLSELLYNFEDLASIRNTTKFLLQNGADLLLKQEFSRKSHWTALDAFCHWIGDGLWAKKRPSDFYPEICELQDYSALRYLFTNEDKFKNRALRNANLLEANKAFSNENFKKALELYLPYAEDDVIIAQTRIAELYSSEKKYGIKADPEEQAYWLEKAALQGDNFAQYMIGTLYSLGLGVSKNLDHANTWLEKAYDSAPPHKKDIVKDQLDKIKKMLSDVN